MSFSAEEVRFLSRHPGDISSATSDLELSRTTLISDVDKLVKLFGSAGRSIAELAAARRSAAGKLPDAWLMCQESAQQSTTPIIAKLRAQRIASALGAGSLIHDVTCSIGTEGQAIYEAGLNYIGSDLDHPRLLMAQYNLGDRAQLLRADALSPSVIGATAIIADPARRSAGRRITDPAQLLPALPDLVETWSGYPLAIKCAPGLDFSQWTGLVSVVSVDGGVKEACLYTPDLATGETREAVVIRNGNADRLSNLLDDAPGENLEKQPGEFIIDPDGAIVRAGLVRHYAIREQLWMLDERIAYLSGNRIPVGTSGFRFIEQVSLKKLKSALAAHHAGSVEILIRGVDVDPDQLRKKMGLRGNRQMAVVITRIGRTAVALICGPRQWN